MVSSDINILELDFKDLWSCLTCQECIDLMGSDSQEYQEHLSLPTEDSPVFRIHFLSWHSDSKHSEDQERLLLMMSLDAFDVFADPVDTKND